LGVLADEAMARRRLSNLLSHVVLRSVAAGCEVVVVVGICDCKRGDRVDITVPVSGEQRVPLGLPAAVDCRIDMRFGDGVMASPAGRGTSGALKYILS
jgi:hypothetical protein